MTELERTEADLAAALAERKVLNDHRRRLDRARGYHEGRASKSEIEGQAGFHANLAEALRWAVQAADESLALLTEEIWALAKERDLDRALGTL